ncbi:MAG TPA: enoyl-CoA hydratase-related protein, partial [bacterium]|nr:enoyl-CoA hydratase-related protein [bacterium]
MDESPLLLTVEHAALAVLTLNRPERVNAITLAMWGQLAELLEGMRERDDVRGLVIRGSGGNFSGGADISEFGQNRRGTQAGLAYEAVFERAVEALRMLPKPTIAAVSGSCMGGACALAMACDFRVAAPDARFAIPAARLGVVYPVPECRLLLGLVGLSRAKRILFTGQAVQAQDAFQIGLVDQVSGNPEQAAREWMAQMLENAPLSIAGAKRILNALASGEAEAREQELQALVKQAMESQDYQEGARAFLEK